MTVERWLRVLAWLILLAAAAAFLIGTWPASLFVVGIGVALALVVWAILFLVATSDS
jgi:uncharacterized membrane protein YiaA